eukprot:SAG31_NODE_2456_length_5663_cov_8.660361_3_plen_42_part_00
MQHELMDAGPLKTLNVTDWNISTVCARMDINRAQENVAFLD